MREPQREDGRPRAMFSDITEDQAQSGAVKLDRVVGASPQRRGRH